jgi:hypothetical protein|uniref:Uncharacterized protein n=1 Tax=Fagus sylvatica TaxID=28930 RepID=A0A2N9HNG6_FAGSY
MVQETRAGVPIWVLSDNVQKLQQQIDEHENSLGLINTKLDKLDRLEANFVTLQAWLEERQPRIQPELVQPQAQLRQGEQTPTNQAQVNVNKARC